MKLEIIKSEGLAHNSYYLSDEGEAVVIDPRRDCEIYTQLAKKECTKIKYILKPIEMKTMLSARLNCKI